MKFLLILHLKYDLSYNIDHYNPIDKLYNRKMCLTIKTLRV